MAVLVACVLGAAGLSVMRGPDLNFDLRNYHYYAAFSLLEGRIDRDLAVAGVQTYFNPLLDLPFYLISRRFGLFWASAAQGTFYGLLVFAVWLFNLRLFATKAFSSFSWVLRCLVLPAFATALGVTGGAAISQMGTTFNEIQISVLVVCSLLAVYISLERERPGRWQFAAGLLLGAAAGLKLTAVTYCLALLLAVVFATGLRRAWRPVLAICVGGSLAFLLTYGWWGWILLEKFQNPIFPFYNAIFQSPWYPPQNFRALRFVPKSLLDAVIYPLNWAFQPSTLASELKQSDPRLSLALVAAAAGLLADITGRRFGAGIRLLVCFTLLSYSIWVAQFGILRYAIPIEVAGGAVVVAVLALLVRPLGAFRHVTAAVVVVSALAGAHFATGYMDWGIFPWDRKATWTSLPRFQTIPWSWSLIAHLASMFRLSAATGLKFLALMARSLAQRDIGYLKKFEQSSPDIAGR